MYKFAIIGAGRIARVHAAAIAAHPKADLVLCASPRVKAAQELVQPFGAAASAEVEDVFSNPDIDAVLVCSPTSYHVDQIINAVTAGKAVLTEKPVDLDLARVDECLAAIAGSEHRAQVGFNRRFDPSVAEVLGRVKRGDIGEPTQLTIISRDASPPPASYVAGSGGIFRDMTIHDLDLARAFLGEFVEVSATGQSWDPAINDFDGGTITLTAADGAMATIINSRRCASGYDQRLEAFGTLGSLEVTNQRATSVRYNTAFASHETSPYLTHFQDRYARSYLAQLDQLISALDGDVAPGPTIRDGRSALELADAATESAMSRRSVPVGQ
jgi:myo-inositol 2-dehydrogenase/D-chiro-inositol 1-dehydrogenase